MNVKHLLTLSLLAMVAVLGAASPDPLTPNASAEPQTSAAQASATRAPPSRNASVKGTVAVDAGLGQPDLSRVVLYLDSDPALDAAPIPRDHYVVGQQNKSFVPNLIVIPRNARVEFPNWDHFDHNVFSRSAAAPAFDLQRYGYCCSSARVFDKVGVVQVFCNIHPFMRAHVIVTPNRYATRAGAGGTFEIPDVPPGKYTLVAWQDRSDEVRTPVEVTAVAGAPGLSLKLVESKRTVNENAGAGSRSGYGVERGVGARREVLNLPATGDIHPAIDPPPGGALPTVAAPATQP